MSAGCGGKPVWWTACDGCPDCQPCPRCHGFKRILAEDQLWSAAGKTYIDCPTCEGEGWWDDTPSEQQWVHGTCPACRGTGREGGK